MSRVHVHGVIAASEPVDAARLVVHGDVAALVSDTGSLRAARVLREHWRVLEQAAAQTTVLPVRFGTVLADDRAVVDEFLVPRHAELAAKLADLAGKVQLTVKGSYDEPALLRGILARSPDIARARGRAQTHADQIELGRRVAAEVERTRDRDTALVLQRLEPHAIAAVAEQPTGLGAVDAAFLVERARADEFAKAVDAIGGELGERIQLRCVGPLPLYSFTGEEAAAWA